MELEQRWSRLLDTIPDGFITAAWANDIFEKAGSSMRAIECDVITRELAGQLLDAAVKIGLIQQPTIDGADAPEEKNMKPIG